MERHRVKYKVQTRFPASGMKEDPGVEVEVEDPKSLLRQDSKLAWDIYDALVNDHSQANGIGSQVIITRVG